MKIQLILFMCLISILLATACLPEGGLPISPTEEKPSQYEDMPQGDVFDYKIAIYTNTLQQNAEEYFAAELAVDRHQYRVVHAAMPDNFMANHEAFIARGLSLVENPQIKVLIINQAVQGTTELLEQISELRPDIFTIIISANGFEDVIDTANLTLDLDYLHMGSAIVEQAQRLGAKTFIDYTKPDTISNQILAQRSKIIQEKCTKLGINYVLIPPEFYNRAMLNFDDISQKVIQYGQNTAFFSGNCAMQVDIIREVLKEGALYAQPCHPSPYHGFPTALGIGDIYSTEYDINNFNENIARIKSELAEKGGTGRFSTWRVPFSMVSTAAAVEYAIRYCEGTISIDNLDVMQDCFQKGMEIYDSADIGFELKQHPDYPNYFLFAEDYILL